VAAKQPVLVIGGTRGTGLLIARRLHQSGMAVRVLARDPDRATRVLGPGIDMVMGDVTKQGTLLGAVEDARHIVFTAGCRSGRPASERLLNRPAGTHAIELTQRSLPLLPRYRIARADVAEAFVAALDHPRAIRATFEIVWRRDGARTAWSDLMETLVPDAP
jgi:uncharacterized protein YbjT (DUF2867 family)